MTDSALFRLNKFISDTGYCSRREADKLIDGGKVTINGMPALMGQKVSADDLVCVDGVVLKPHHRLVYIALNKPAGITCTTESHVEGNIVDFVNHSERIFPIGRLDKASDGLILLTNDGDIVNKILRAGNQHEKEYVVRVDKQITAEFLRQMRTGVPILDTVTLPCQVHKETDYSFRITLTQGLNRQIRRMCEALGYNVFKLRRVRIMNIELNGIGHGKWRYLTEQELAELLAMCETSDGSEKASRQSVSGSKIAKATPAKLYDHRQANKASNSNQQGRNRNHFEGKRDLSRTEHPLRAASSYRADDQRRDDQRRDGFRKDDRRGNQRQAQSKDIDHRRLASSQCSRDPNKRLGGARGLDELRTDERRSDIRQWEDQRGETHRNQRREQSRSFNGRALTDRAHHDNRDGLGYKKNHAPKKALTFHQVNGGKLASEDKPKGTGRMTLSLKPKAKAK